MCCLAQFLVKYILFFANFLFSLAGLGLIGLGTAAQIQLPELPDVIPGAINAISIAVIVLGCIIFSIAFFGCCGAIRESRCLLGSYFVCMAILAAGKIYLTVVVFRGLDNIQGTVEGWVNEAFVPGPPAQTAQPFDVLQVAFRCCGSTGPASYGTFPLPGSCCEGTSSNTATCAAADAFAVGCTTRMGSYFESMGGAVGGVLIGVIVVEVVAMIFGLFLCASVKKS